MSKTINIWESVVEGNIRGDVIELDNGHLVAHAYISGGDRFITKSTDGGVNWVTTLIFKSVPSNQKSPSVGEVFVGSPVKFIWAAPPDEVIC